MSVPVANADFSNVGIYVKDGGSQIEVGYNAGYRNQVYSFFDQNAGPISIQNVVNMPRIRPVAGDSPDQNDNDDSATAFGTVLNSNYFTRPDHSVEFWQMVQYHNVLYWKWKLTADRVAWNKMAAQWSYVMSQFSTIPQGQTSVTWGLHSDGSGDGTINFSDDGAWYCQYLMQVHDAGIDGPGEPALQALVDKIPRILTRFADTQTAGRTVTQTNGFSYSKYGIYYNSSNYVSTPYEIGIMLAALHVFEHTSFNDYLDYVTSSWTNWLTTKLKHSSGNYYGGISLSNFAPNDSTFSYPKFGSSAIYLLGSESMGVLAARLYRITQNQQYLTEAISLASAIKKPQDGGTRNSQDTLLSANASKWGFVTTNTVAIPGILLNGDDPYTGSFYAVPFSNEFFALPGVDVDGSCSTVYVATGAAIASGLGPESGSGLTGDWGGTLTSNIPGSADSNGKATYGLFKGYPTYQSQFDYYAANLMTDSDQYAGHQQITTSSNTLSRLMAGYILDRRNRGAQFARLT